MVICISNAFLTSSKDRFFSDPAVTESIIAMDLTLPLLIPTLNLTEKTSKRASINFPVWISKWMMKLDWPWETNDAVIPTILEPETFAGLFLIFSNPLMIVDW